MRKLITATAFCAAMAAAVAVAEYVIVPVEAPAAAAYKTVPTHNVQVGKVIAIEAYNVESNKTITLSRILADGSTNTVSTQTTTAADGGNQTFDLSTTGYFWVQKGETWRRAGTETNATVRLIIDQ